MYNFYIFFIEILCNLYRFKKREYNSIIFPHDWLLILKRGACIMVNLTEMAKELEKELSFTPKELEE